MNGGNTVVTSVLFKLVTGNVQGDERINISEDDYDESAPSKPAVYVSYNGNNVRASFTLTREQYIQELLLAIPEDTLRQFVDSLPERVKT